MSSTFNGNRLALETLPALTALYNACIEAVQQQLTQPAVTAVEPTVSAQQAGGPGVSANTSVPDPGSTITSSPSGGTVGTPATATVGDTASTADAAQPTRAASC